VTAPTDAPSTVTPAILYPVAGVMEIDWLAPLFTFTLLMVVEPLVAVLTLLLFNAVITPLPLDVAVILYVTGVACWVDTVLLTSLEYPLWTPAA